MDRTIGLINIARSAVRTTDIKLFRSPLSITSRTMARVTIIPVSTDIKSAMGRTEDFPYRAEPMGMGMGMGMNTV